MKYYGEVISKVIDYIEEHLEEELNLKKIAQAAGYSKFHLHRMFAAKAGCTIHQYIQKRRLTEAAKQLIYTNESIISVALSAGYETQQSFTSAFKKMYLVSPQVYRKQKQFSPIQIKMHQINRVSSSYMRMSQRSGVKAA